MESSCYFIACVSWLVSWLVYSILPYYFSIFDEDVEEPDEQFGLGCKGQSIEFYCI